MNLSESGLTRIGKNHGLIFFFRQMQGDL